MDRLYVQDRGVTPGLERVRAVRGVIAAKAITHFQTVDYKIPNALHVE